MFGGDAHQMIAATAVALGDAADGEVVAFGGAAGEDDFLWVGADGGGDRVARLVDGGASFVAESVAHAAGVAVLLAEVGEHRLDDARVDPRRGVVVHVDELEGNWAAWFAKSQAACRRGYVVFYAGTRRECR